MSERIGNRQLVEKGRVVLMWFVEVLIADVLIVVLVDQVLAEVLVWTILIVPLVGGLPQLETPRKLEEIRVLLQRLLLLEQFQLLFLPTLFLLIPDTTLVVSDQRVFVGQEILEARNIAGDRQRVRLILGSKVFRLEPVVTHLLDLIERGL